MTPTIREQFFALNIRVHICESSLDNPWMIMAIGQVLDFLSSKLFSLDTDVIYFGRSDEMKGRVFVEKATGLLYPSNLVKYRFGQQFDQEVSSESKIDLGVDSNLTALHLLRRLWENEMKSLFYNNSAPHIHSLQGQGVEGLLHVVPVYNGFNNKMISMWCLTDSMPFEENRALNVLPFQTE